MNIKDCGFNQFNIYIAVFLDGRVMLGNRDTQMMYEVNVVKAPKIKKSKGYKKVKIERLEK